MDGADDFIVDGNTWREVMDILEMLSGGIGPDEAAAIIVRARNLHEAIIESAE